jgi:hypothetical protein
MKATDAEKEAREGIDQKDVSWYTSKLRARRFILPGRAG